MTGPHQVRGPRRGHLTLSLSLTLHLQAGARPKDLASPSALLLPIPWTSRPQHTSTAATAGPLPCALALSRPQVPRPRCLPSRTPGSQHPCCSEVARLSPCNTPHPRHPAQHPPPPLLPVWASLAGLGAGRLLPRWRRDQRVGRWSRGLEGREEGVRVEGHGPGGGLGAFTSRRTGGPGGHRGKMARPASGRPRPADFLDSCPQLNPRGLVLPAHPGPHGSPGPGLRPCCPHPALGRAPALGTFTPCQPPGGNEQSQRGRVPDGGVEPTEGGP